MSHNAKLRRRTLLAAGGVVAASRTLPAADATRPGRHHTYGWVNQVDGPRPRFAWENREDVIYHDVAYPDEAINRAPELWALMRCPWTFNRGMRWVRPGRDVILCHTTGGDLALTGDGRVSDWHSDPDNRVVHTGARLRFEKRSTLRCRDAAVLPSLQLHLGQTPLLTVDVTDADVDWQVCVSQKGRSGPPLLASDWRRGPATLSFDLAEAFARRGHDGQFAELHVVLGVWTGQPQRSGSVTFAATLRARPALVAALPIVRTAVAGRARPPIAAAAFTTEGTPVRRANGRIDGVVGGKRLALVEREGVWMATLPALPPGEHRVRLIASGAVVDERETVVRIGEGAFFGHDRANNLIVRRGRPVRPMTGSYQGAFFVRDAGLPSEALVQGQEAWDAWDRAAGAGEHQHYWEALGERELETRFAYLAHCGFDWLHLHSHYGIWERLDAGGQIAPHGAEALARYVRVAARHGLAVMVTMSSYPYGVGTKGWADGTTPYLQYVEAGFTNEQWYDPTREPFRSRYHQYLRDVLTLFRDEDAIASFSSSGEGDWRNGPARFVDTQQVIRSMDRNHVVVSEPINMVEKLPPNQVVGFPSDLVGNRTYCLGWNMPFEEEMGIVFHLGRMVPNLYLAEGCYPSSNLYTRMSIAPDKEEHESWVGTDLYRRNVRDVLYLGLVNRMPILMTWDEAFTEDERIVLRKVRDGIDWRTRWRAPRVAIVVEDRDAHEKGRPALAKYGRAFARLGLDYRFVARAEDAAAGDWVIDHHGDGGRTFDERAVSAGEGLPPAVQATVPFQVSPGYGAHSLVAEDGGTMLAYFHNAAAHTRRKTYISPTHHRRPVPSSFEVRFSPGPALAYELWDLGRKEIVRQGRTDDAAIAIAGSVTDYLLVARRRA